MFNRSKKHKQRNTATNCIKILPHQKKCFPLRKSNLNGIYWNMEKNIEISLLEPNKGQIKGLPRNPRTIKDKRFKALKKSIEDAPEMLALRELLVYPHNGKFVVIGGNMRLKAVLIVSPIFILAIWRNITHTKTKKCRNLWKIWRLLLSILARQLK